ncbi:MAG: FAD:protein FMN transferase [Lachnospiraceae bacterium]|nr:FAD:protein FMN transferase [Lachnospiraceae bacterium]
MKTTRSFKKGLLLIALCLTSLMLTSCDASDVTNIFSNKKEYSTTLFAMDTYMTLTAYGKNAQEAVTAATKEITYLEDIFSTNIDTSEIAQVNANGGGDVSEDTAFLIQKSIDYYNETYGTYDISVYPLVYEWGFTTQDYKVPTENRIEELLPLIGSDKLHLSYHDDGSATVSFDKKGMMIDLGTIAKGYASQKVADIFKEYDIESGLINLGGNVQLVGSKTDGTNWNVAIQKPDKDAEDSDYVGILSTSDCAVTTAGGYERYFEEDGITYRHIFDPSTGRPTESTLKSVSIVTKSGIDADGYDTALFVMDLDGAISFWREHKDLFDVILIAEDDTIYISEGIADSFTTDYTVEVIK